MLLGELISWNLRRMVCRPGDLHCRRVVSLSPEPFYFLVASERPNGKGRKRGLSTYGYPLTCPPGSCPRPPDSPYPSSHVANVNQSKRDLQFEFSQGNPKKKQRDRDWVWLVSPTIRRCVENRARLWTKFPLRFPVSEGLLPPCSSTISHGVLARFRPSRCILCVTTALHATRHCLGALPWQYCIYNIVRQHRAKLIMKKVFK
jgi:hypothetical protein